MNTKPKEVRIKTVFTILQWQTATCMTAHEKCQVLNTAQQSLDTQGEPAEEETEYRLGQMQHLLKTYRPTFS